jgi:hypothetical protein
VIPTYAQSSPSATPSFARALGKTDANRPIGTLDPDAAALAIVGQLRGIGLQLVLVDDVPDFDHLRQTVTRLLQTGLS